MGTASEQMYTPHPPPFPPSPPSLLTTGAVYVLLTPLTSSRAVQGLLLSLINIIIFTLDCMRDAGESGVSPTWGSPEWAARREVEVLKLLCDGNVAKMQKLWLRKQRSVASCSRQPAGAQPRPSQSRAAGQKLEPAAQPKQRTPAQAARRERSLKQLRQKSTWPPGCGAACGLQSAYRRGASVRRPMGCHGGVARVGTGLRLAAPHSSATMAASGVCVGATGKCPSTASPARSYPRASWSRGQ